MAFMLPAFFSKIGAFIVGNWAKIKAAAYLATFVVGVKGYRQAKNMLGKGQDILANKTSAGGKIPVIYGTRRVGAQIVYMDVSGNDSKDLYVVYALSVGEVDEIIGKTIELDGNRLTDSARFRDGGYIGSDKISSGAGSLNTVSQNGTGIDAGAGQFGSSPTSKYRYVMNLHHGAASQTADPMLVASMPNWTSAHKLNGIAYIAAHYGFDAEGIWSGVPQLTVQVRGKKVYDPRSGETAFTDSTGKVIGDNPALCFLDYITNDEYGKGLTASQINMTTFGAAATVCETQVDQPYFNGTAKSLTWSGTAGDDFITISGSSANAEWYQNKIAELINLFDANGNGVLDGVEIKDIQRTNYFGSTENFRIFFNGTLGSTYSPQTGTSLLKVKRFQCNGYLDTNKNVMENAKELLANMRGIFLYINGKYELSIEDTGSSTFSINDNHIISDAGISVDYGNKDKKANKVIVEFFNANKKYELDTATVLHDATPEYYSDDGDEILEIKAEFPYITDPYIAYNMGKAILTRSRNQTTMQFLGTPEMYKLNVGDIVDLTYTGLGFSGKVCRVEALELQPNGLVAVSLIEYFDVYTWEVPPQEPVEELANLPSAYAVKAPTGLAFTDTDSSSTGRPFLSWDEPTDFPDYQYRVNVVDGSSNQVINRIVDVENCDLNFVPTGSYVASVTSLNTLGTESSAATLSFTIGDAPTATDDIQNDAITTPKILDGNVTNAKINTLSAAKINTGELNLGQESGMAVRQTKTGYTSTATGFWLGNDGGTPKFNIGTSTNYLKFDGTDLDISGEISATTGSIGGFTVGNTSLIAGTGASRISLSTVDGIHLGNNTFASAPFRVELDGSLTATDATVTGVLTLTNIDGSTVVYSNGNLVVGTIGGDNLGSSAIFPTTLRYERSNSTSAPSNSEFNTAFGRNPRSNDIVVVSRTDTNAQVAYKHNGTSFSAVSNYIDGDLIVDGSITTDQLAANSVEANQINVGTLSAISANMGSITAGSMNIGSGAFTVSSAGVMTATGATISGALTATSLNVTNATVTGTLDASVILLNNEPLDNVLTYSETGGIGLLTLNEGAAIDGDFVVDGNFEATGLTPDLIVGKVTGISSDTTQADAILRSSTGSGSFKIQAGSSNTTVVSLGYDALGGTTLLGDTGAGGSTGKVRINVDGSLGMEFNESRNATFAGEVKANALELSSNTPSTTTNKLYNTSGTLYWNGSAVNTGAGDITGVTITTTGGSLTGGAAYTSGDATFTLDIGSTITGAKTFDNNVVIQGDLDVQGTTTTIDTTNLDVKDKNITLNYGTGDTSANANGAGITIQDAVSAGNDATLTWNTSNDSFNFSHNLNFADNVKAQFGTSNDLQIFSNGTSSYIMESGSGNLEIRATDIFLKSADNTKALATFDADGASSFSHNGSIKLATTSTGIDVTGNLQTTGYLAVNGTSNTGAGTDRWIGGDGTAGTWFYNVPTGSNHYFAVNNTNKLTVNSTGIQVGTFSGNSVAQISAGTTGISSLYLGDGSSGAASYAGFVEYNHTGDYLRLGAGSAERVRVNSTGIDVTGDITLGDTNPTITFNDSSVTNLSHTILSSSDNLRLAVDVNGVDAGSRVEIFDGSTEVARFSAGAMLLTGTATMDGLTVDGSGTINQSANTDINGLNGLRINDSTGTGYGAIGVVTGNDLRITSGDAGGTNDKAISFRTANAGTERQRLRIGGTGDISFYEDTGTTAKFFWDASAESLFIGATSASALNSFSDDLIISNTTSGTGAGISIVSNATNGYSNIHFGDTDDADIGRIQYNNATNEMTFRTNTSDAMTINSTGNTTFAGTINSGAITSTGNITAGDNIVIGSGGTYQAGNIYSDSNWGMILRAKQENPTAADFLFTDYADNHLVRFDGSYGLRIQTGGLQIGTTTVIDSSRNLTNIGTISSGSITVDPSGTYGDGITINAGDNLSASYGAKQIVMSWGGSTSIDYAHSIRTRHNSNADTGNTVEVYLWDYGTDSSSTIGTKRALVLENSTGLDLLTGGYRVGGQEVITSSRNLTNIGTINSGAITTSGHIQQNNGYEIRSKDTGGTVRTIMRVNSSNELEYGWSGNGKVKIMGGGSYTERFSIGTDGNATFSGTISSGAVANIYTSSDRGYFVAGTNDASNQHLYFGSYHGTTLKELTFSGSNNGFYPQTDASIDLGLSSKKFKNLYLSGTINSGAITSTGDISGATIEGYVFPSYPSQSGGVLTSTVSGDMAWSFNTVSSYVDSGDDRIITSTGSTGIRGESNLTYNETDGLKITDSLPKLSLIATSSSATEIILDSSVQGFINFKDGATTDASIGYEGVFNNKLSISCSNGITFGSSNLETTGTIDSGPIHILGATGGDKLAYASNFEANGANIQLTLERTGSGWGGIGASGGNAFMVYSSSIVQRFGVTQAGSLLANGGTEFLTATRDLVNIGTISSGAISANSGTTNVVATFTSTDTTAAIALTDNAGTVELSATGTTFGIQPNGAAAVFKVFETGQVHLFGARSIRADSPISFNTTGGAAQTGLFKAVAAQTSYANSASDGMFNALNGYAVGTGTGTTVIDASRNGVFVNLRADGGNLIMGDEAYSVSSSYVGMKTSFQSGSTDYMIISGVSDGNTYVSAKDGGTVYIRGGGNYSANQISVPDASTITATTSDFRVSGNVTAYASDARLKTNIKTIENPIEKIKKIRGVEFDWIDNIENFNPKFEHETGVIAQEIEEVIPDAVSPAPFNEEYKTVDKEKIVALLIEAIKDQQKQIDELKARLDNDSSN